jgi:hypothetical protein
VDKREIKRRIRAGEAVPHVDRDLFESAYTEVLQEDHPGWRATNLVESRQSGNDFSRDVYQCVARMIDANDDSPVPQDRTLSESRPVLDPPQTEETFLRALHEAAEQFRRRTDPEAIAIRAKNLDDKLPPRRPQERTMAEMMAEADRLYKYHALIARMLPDS